MQLICISRGSYSRGKDLAERLAEKLGYCCLSREEMLEEAASRGISVGKLEMAMLKSHPLTERLSLERDHYQALVTSILCERALKESIVYHGRTAHLLLPGVAHVLRLRVVADMEYRIHDVMQRLDLPRDKAKDYIQRVEEDRKRWVRFFYNVDWDSSSLYEVILNLERWNVDNAASALCGVAQLPDFQMTPAARKTLEDLLLASKCRLAIAEDERTWEGHVKVRSQNGVVSVIYLPHQADIAEHIPDVVRKVEGVRDLVCTLARTNILWVQEQFKPGTAVFHQMVEIANKWDAAVELLRLVPVEDDDVEESEEDETAAAEQEVPSQRMAPRHHEGGIEEEGAIESETDNGGLKPTVAELIRLGRSGGGRTVRGKANDLLAAVDRSIQYSLVVIGDVYVKKGRAAQIRKGRELASFLSDQLKVSAVMADEIKPQYLFGKKQLLQFAAFLVCALALYGLVFLNEDVILRFFSADAFGLRVLRMVAVVAFVPLFAYLYGTAARLFLKMLKLD